MVISRLSSCCSLLIPMSTHKAENTVTRYIRHTIKAISRLLSYYSLPMPILMHKVDPTATRYRRHAIETMLRSFKLLLATNTDVNV